MNKADKIRYTALAEIGCIVCRASGVRTPPEMHHLRCSGSMGKRAPNTDTIPLCHTHHRTGGYGVAYHAGRAVWERKFGTELQLLARTNEMLNEGTLWC